LYASVEYVRSVGEIRPWGAAELGLEEYQMLAFHMLVLLGGWLLGWIHGVRRVRLNLLYTVGGKPSPGRR